MRLKCKIDCVFADGTKDCRAEKIKRTAYNLAEVLITIGIIGVVAAITISGLIKKYQEYVLHNQLKRCYSVLSQTVTQLNYEYDGNWDINLSQVFDDITAKIKTVKLCKGKSGCFESAPIKYRGRSGHSGNWNANNRCKFVINTGEFVMISKVEGLVSSDYGYTIKNPKFELSIDINGMKRPNEYGKDVFEFGIRDGILVPAGIDTKSESCKNRQGPGYDCAWMVLVEGKFPR